jgi:hypothetical protein
MKNAILVAAAAGLTLSACSVREGRIGVPPHLLASTDRLELRGMGGWERGNFNIDGVPGSFTRTAERLGIFDPLLVRHSGGGSFRLAASHLGPELAGRCYYTEQEVNVGPVSVTPDRLFYHCDFARNGRPIHASLVLRDPKSALGTLHGRNERSGWIDYDGRRIKIRSTHRDEGGGLATPTALGYYFTLNGTRIGAIDVNGTNKTIFTPRAGLEREAVIAGSLALSIFWDPANI